MPPVTRTTSEPRVTFEIHEPCPLELKADSSEELHNAMEDFIKMDCSNTENSTTSQSIYKAQQAVALEHAFMGSKLGRCAKRATIWNSILRKLPNSRIRRHYWIDADDKSLRWRSTRKKSADARIPLHHMKEILLPTAKRRRSFVVMLHDGTSVQLRAQDRAQMKLWVQALRIASDPTKFSNRKRMSELFHDWVRTLDSSMIGAMLEEDEAAGSKYSGADKRYIRLPWPGDARRGHINHCRIEGTTPYDVQEIERRRIA